MLSVALTAPPAPMEICAGADCYATWGNPSRWRCLSPNLRYRYLPLTAPLFRSTFLRSSYGNASRSGGSMTTIVCFCNSHLSLFCREKLKGAPISRPYAPCRCLRGLNTLAFSIWTSVQYSIVLYRNVCCTESFIARQYTCALGYETSFDSL